MKPTAGLLIVAHAPLAHALRQCVLHVYPDAASGVAAVDVQPNAHPDESLGSARIAMDQLHNAGARGVLVLTDVFGATPSNVAQRLVDGHTSRLVAGVNLPMLLRTINYRHEPLEALVSRAVAGATQGIVSVAITAPQNQARRSHDSNERDHQQ
jgi:mannose PTS system EIIA component